MRKIYLVVLLCSLHTVYGKKYKGAEIRTVDSYTYGKFEVRMKSAAGSGMLSSFFTFYDAPDFAQNWNEIDIEILGRYNNEVQYNTIVGNHKMNEHRQVLDFNPHEGFHVYSLEWTPDYVSWQVDGKELYKQEGEHIKALNKNQKLMMNIWPSTFWNWTGLWNDSILPVYAYYDYVRYSEYTPDKSEKFTFKWEDHFDMMDPARWQTATHTFNGNSCDFDPANVVFRDGYLILCLTKEENPGYSGGPVVDAPVLLSAALSGSNILRLSFSRDMTIGEIKKSNFSIEGVLIKKTKLGKNKKEVDLTLEGENIQSAAEIKYSLYSGESVQNIFIKKEK
ncbi:MAG: family 16 glycosylhydrolase [Cytophagaceae bacterium]|nr:family 16 glycosylhydrolase [Cytophagaceae bacterium]